MNAQKMVLVDTSHRLPMPGTQRLFSADGELVDLHDPFWRNLALDGSIKPAPSDPAAPSAGAATTSATSDTDALEAAETAVTAAAGLIDKLRHPQA